MSNYKKHLTYETIRNPRLGLTFVDFFFKGEHVIRMEFITPKKSWSLKPIFPNVWTINKVDVFDQFKYIEGIITQEELWAWGKEIVGELPLPRLRHHNRS